MSSSRIEEGLAAIRDGDATAARRGSSVPWPRVSRPRCSRASPGALYLERDYTASAAHHERAYAAYRRESRIMDAGRAARTAAWITGNVLGDWAVRSGWLARARAVLEQAGDDRAGRWSATPATTRISSPPGRIMTQAGAPARA